MNPFGAAAATWQNFYLLTGTAAATLIGLMFVALTFGAGAITVKNVATARSFLDPTLTHFVQVLLTGCLMVVPSMPSIALGACFVGIGAFRLHALLGIFRQMRAAHREYNDVELSDWVSGIVIPLVAHLGLAGTGIAFLAGHVALWAIAVVTIVILLNGIYGAWELVVWMAVMRSRRSE